MNQVRVGLKKNNNAEKKITGPYFFFSVFIFFSALAPRSVEKKIAVLVATDDRISSEVLQKWKGCRSRTAWGANLGANNGPHH